MQCPRFSHSLYLFFVITLPGNKLHYYYFVLPTLNVLFAACRFAPPAVLEVSDQQVSLTSREQATTTALGQTGYY